MNKTAVHTRRKNIDIREDVYRFLSIKAAASGTNLKNYIEALLEKEVEDMDEAATCLLISLSTKINRILS